MFSGLKPKHVNIRKLSIRRSKDLCCRQVILFYHFVLCKRKPDFEDESEKRQWGIWTAVIQKVYSWKRRLLGLHSVGIIFLTLFLIIQSVTRTYFLFNQPIIGKNLHVFGFSFLESNFDHSCSPTFPSTIVTLRCIELKRLGNRNHGTKRKKEAVFSSQQCGWRNR